MIKIRVMGTKSDLNELKEEFQVEVGSYVMKNISEPLPLQGTEKYSRMYGELHKKEEREDTDIHE